MAYVRRADRQPTFVSLVLAALRSADDFLTIEQLRAAVPDLTKNRATASLAHLRKGRTADFMVSEGVTYWYSTGEDDRTRTTEERVREPAGNRTRRSRARPLRGSP